MKILTVDVGTGTQDILLYNPDLDAENSLKMVLPAPTMIFRRKIQMATQARQPVLLTGVIMGVVLLHGQLKTILKQVCRYLQLRMQPFLFMTIWNVCRKWA